jgi:hypothetical protein
MNKLQKLYLSCKMERHLADKNCQNHGGLRPRKADRLQAHRKNTVLLLRLKRVEKFLRCATKQRVLFPLI